MFGTLHVAYFNPVFAAKQCVTAHHIGSGRFGLNVVSGTSARPAMFGVPARHHDADYDYTEEWVTIVKRIWNETGAVRSQRANTSTSRTCSSKPQALRRPGADADQRRPLASRPGICDGARRRALHRDHRDAQRARGAAARRARRAPSGEHVPIYGSSHLVCRPTRKEADEYYHYLVHELGDWDDMDDVAGALAARPDDADRGHRSR